MASMAFFLQSSISLRSTKVQEQEPGGRVADQALRASPLLGSCFPQSPGAIHPHSLLGLRLAPPQTALLHSATRSRIAAHPGRSGQARVATAVTRHSATSLNTLHHHSACARPAGRLRPC